MAFTVRLGRPVRVCARERHGARCVQERGGLYAHRAGRRRTIQARVPEGVEIPVTGSLVRLVGISQFETAALGPRGLPRLPRTFSPVNFLRLPCEPRAP